MKLSELLHLASHPSGDESLDMTKLMDGEDILEWDQVQDIAPMYLYLVACDIYDTYQDDSDDEQQLLDAENALEQCLDDIREIQDRIREERRRR